MWHSRKTDRQNICRIYAHIQEEFAHKNWTSILISDGENQVSPLNLTDGQTDGRAGWTEICNYRVATLLKYTVAVACFKYEVYMLLVAKLLYKR